MKTLRNMNGITSGDKVKKDSGEGVFVPAYKPRIYPWLNTDEARIFDKARTSHFVFSLD